MTRVQMAMARAHGSTSSGSKGAHTRVGKVMYGIARIWSVVSGTATRDSAAQTYTCALS